jgi:hypothetical protein
MDPELQNIEDALKACRPVMPAPACMDRLLAALEGRMLLENPSLRGVEDRLAAMEPSSVSDSVAASMLATVSKVPFPVDDKVVLFPVGTKPAGRSESRRPWFAAAAAVAVAGAFTALMVDPSTPKTSGGMALSGKETAPAAALKGFVPASLGSGVEEAKDEGVMWTPDGKAMRMVKVIYMDKVKFLNERGEVIEVEQPRVEYLMVPEKID